MCHLRFPARSRSGVLVRATSGGPCRRGITDNQHKRSKTAKDGRRLARRFRDNQDMILRFATDLTVGFTSNQAERDVRPVKVQQRTSGGPAGALSMGSPTSQSSSPTCPPPPNGASASSTRYASSS